MRRILLLIIIFTTGVATATTPTTWTNLAPGLSYTPVETAPYSKIHAFRIDPNIYNFQFAPADPLAFPEGAHISEFVQGNNAVIAVNGGFFTPEHRPLGLRMENGIVQNPLKPVSWWGIFYIQNGKPYIVGQKEFNPKSPKITFAIQAGPRLIINGKIPTLKETLDERSALCIDENNNVILVSTQNAAFTLTDFAKILQTPTQEGGLGCYNALNLDGGHSSQLYAKMKSFELLVPNFSRIADAILVVPKGASS